MSNRSIVHLGSTAESRREEIYNKALKFLEARLHTRYELERKLRIRGYDKALVNTVLTRLSELDYLNDERFAQLFLDNLIKYKTFGFYGIKAKLMARGVDKELMEKLLANFSLEDEKQLALKLLEKKREKDPAKLARSLAAKGFRSQVIKQILNV